MVELRTNGLSMDLTGSKRRDRSVKLQGLEMGDERLRHERPYKKGNGVRKLIVIQRTDGKKEHRTRPRSPRK